jgi:glyoxylase-like metal-dependent hydrolase (beta-lactamase superfamily II)
MATQPTATAKTLITLAEKKPNSYIIILHGHADKSSHLSELRQRLRNGEAITHGDWDKGFFNGYAVKLNTGSDNGTLNYLLAHPDVCHFHQICWRA